jgi:hypothetical protein
MNLIKNILNYVNPLPHSNILTVICFFQLLIHFKYLHLPPVGFHQWRQVHTLAVARNFFEEEMNILHPRIDERGKETGITGMEFPIVNYIIAVLYKLFGFHHSIGRIVILIFSFICLTGCYFFIHLFFQSKISAIIGSIFLLFSPLFGYYSITVLPDIPALAFLFFGLYFFYSYLEIGKKYYLLLFFLTYTLSSLIKISYLIFLPIFLTEIWNSGSKYKIDGLFSILVTLTIVTAWYIYARFLSHYHHNYSFLLNIKYPYSLYTLYQVIKKTFIQWLPELYINYAQFVFFLVGIPAFFRNENKQKKVFVLIYGLSFLLYYMAFLPQFEIHDYYFIPALPLLLLFCIKGFEHLLSLSFQKKWISYLTTFLILIMPILGCVRSLSRFEDADKPWDLLTIENHLNRVAPNRKKLILVAGDASPCIYLYYMHRKGWPVSDTMSEQQLKEYIQQGASYLVSSSVKINTNPEILNNAKKISHYGRFVIYELIGITEKKESRK